MCFGRNATKLQVTNRKLVVCVEEMTTISSRISEKTLARRQAEALMAVRLATGGRMPYGVSIRWSFRKDCVNRSFIWASSAVSLSRAEDMQKSEAWQRKLERYTFGERRVEKEQHLQLYEDDG